MLRSIWRSIVLTIILNGILGLFFRQRGSRRRY